MITMLHRTAQAQLGAQPGQPIMLVARHETVDDLGGQLDRPAFVVGDQRQQGFRQAGQVPAGNAGLRLVGIAPHLVDGTEHRARIEGLHESAGAEVDALAGNSHVVGVHHAVNKARMHPLRDQRRLAFCHGAQETEIALLGAGEFREMAGDGVIGELADLLRCAMRREVLKGAHAQMARGHPRQDGAGQRTLAKNRLAAGHHRQRARGRNAQRVHRLADQHLAQHRPHRCLAVAPAGKRRAPRALQGNVAAPAVAVDDLADQQRAAVAQLGIELPELMSRIGLGNGLRALRQRVAGKHCCQRGIVPPRFNAQLLRQSMIEEQQHRFAYRRGLARFVEARQLAGIGVVERDGGIGHRWVHFSGAGVRLADGGELGANRAEIPPQCDQGNADSSRLATANLL